MTAASSTLGAGERRNASNPCLAAVWPALQRLDSLLEAAVRAMQPARGSESAALFRGLYIDHLQVVRLLAQYPGANPYGAVRQILDLKPNVLLSTGSPLARVSEEFGLDPFDADVLLIALAPELDLRYERIFAYLQDDVTRKRPTVELVLNLLCENTETKLARRAHFSPQAPLRREGLVNLLTESNQPESPLLAHSLCLDDQITRVLLGQENLDPRLAPFCKLVVPLRKWEQLQLSGEIKHNLPQIATQSLCERRPLHLYFRGASPHESRATAEGLAGTLGLRLLFASIERMPGREAGDSLWNLFAREGKIHGAALFVSDFDDLGRAELLNRRQDLLDAVAKYPGITILAGRKDWIPTNVLSGVLPVDFEIPGFVDRCDSWRASLEKCGAACDPNDIAVVASHFQLSSGQIEQAVAAAVVKSRWRAASSREAEHSPEDTLVPAPSVAELSAAARAQCGHELAALAHKIEPHYTWSDLILPPDPKAQLREICQQAEYRNVVYDQWGFDRKLSLGKGLNVLFSGPPGTGKTMGAEVIANKLGLDLYRIDLSQVVSKYIGETEKNLDRIFSVAQYSNAILFFDEADALYGKRTEVRDSHDRYANIEISYLLQKMEEYQGMSILATNLRQNLDEAFVRRLQAIVEFPFPDELYRRQIWENVFPREAPVGEDVKFDLLAREVRLAGGNIKNIALAAAFSAAADQGVIHLSHLAQAAYREHQKLARSWNPGTLSEALAARA